MTNEQKIEQLANQNADLSRQLRELEQRLVRLNAAVKEAFDKNDIRFEGIESKI